MGLVLGLHTGNDRSPQDQKLRRLTPKPLKYEVNYTHYVIQR